tara:strand:- start:10137 stop:12062 length:1926 start_codon:yes stop_codon:yes gene_type:complete
MCGIAGIRNFQTDATPVESRLLKRMATVMTHRGPDGEGVWVHENRQVGFSHRRLSIIDLAESAAQPMSDSGGDIWVTYNGEIYNHAELRRELIDAGVGGWRTDHSDTEVLIKAYAYWGRKCVDHFRGMFAFALWDGRDGSLWLVRDRVGIKPLYYTVDDNRIIFASEIKAILQDTSVPRCVNEEAFMHYLSFLTTPGPDTLFEGIQKLPGGCWMLCKSDGTTRTERYWDAFDNADAARHISDAEASEGIMACLDASIKYRGVSDVPVGVFLSGGVDSSTNLALLSKHFAKAPASFSVGYGADAPACPSELEYAREMVDFIGGDGYARELKANDLLAFMDRMIELQDEPIGDAVCFPMYFVSALAKSHGVSVCQVGEGADELFCGYASWEAALQRQQRMSSPLNRSVIRAGLGLLAMTGRQRDDWDEWSRRATTGTPQFWSGAEAFFEGAKKRVISERLRSDFKDMTSWDALQPIRKRFEASTDDHSPLNWMTYSDLNLRLPELLLMRVDKMSMGASVEARVPFLDHELIAFALSLPASQRYVAGQPKRLLRNGVRGLIPDAVIDRPKQGFGVPIHDWFQGSVGAEMIETVRSFAKQTDFFDATAIEAMIDNGNGVQLWFLFNFAKWWQKYIAQPQLQPMAS